MPGQTNEPGRPRIRAANAAYRRAAFQQIIASKKTCRDTVAYMFDKLPEELIVMILTELVLLHSPRMEVSSEKSLPDSLRGVVRCLFAITGTRKEPPAARLRLATDAALVASTYCLRAAHLIDVAQLSPSLTTGPKYGNVRHIVLSIPLQGAVINSSGASYHTELYRTTRAMSSMKAWLPRAETFCLEIGFAVTEEDKGATVDWATVLDAPCRKGFMDVVTLRAEISRLIGKFATEGPGYRKSIRMTLAGYVEGKEIDVGRIAIVTDGDEAGDLAGGVLRAATGEA